MDAAFSGQDLCADSGKRTEDLLPVRVILNFCRVDICRPSAWGGHGVHNWWSNVESYQVGVIVFGNVLDVRDGLSGGWKKSVANRIFRNRTAILAVAVVMVLVLLWSIVPSRWNTLL